MKHLLTALILASFAMLGCSTELKLEPARDISIQIALTTEDEVTSLHEIHFAASEGLRGASKSARPPKAETDGTFRHDHTIHSSSGNFVILHIYRNGEPFQTEIYSLTPESLAQIGNTSGYILSLIHISEPTRPY